MKSVSSASEWAQDALEQQEQVVSGQLVVTRGDGALGILNYDLYMQMRMERLARVAEQAANASPPTTEPAPSQDVQQVTGYPIASTYVPFSSGTGATGTPDTNTPDSPGGDDGNTPASPIPPAVTDAVGVEPPELPAAPPLL